jgi:DNA-binding Lrp family transcriptional regulator
MRPIAKEQSPIQFPLSFLLGTASHVRLLRILADDVVGPISSPEAARRTGLTEAGARRALDRLAKTGYIKRVGGGRSQQYELRRDELLSEDLRSLFRQERKRFEDLFSGIRSGFGELHEVRHAWAHQLPRGVGEPLEISFVSDAESLSWIKEEVRRRLLKVEEAFDLIIEIHGFTRADAPEPPDEESILLAGTPFKPKKAPGISSSTHRAREERALRMSQAIAELLDKNPSLIRRAIRHIERILRDDPGSAIHDLEEWRAILGSYSLERTREFLVAGSSRAERLRQSSPFFAVLTPTERDFVFQFTEAGE